MNRQDIALLLAFCAAFDQRTIGEADVEAWHAALDCPWVPNMGREEAQAAVTEHYRATAERITPADIIKRVKDTRADRMSRAIPQAESAPPTAEYLEARAALDAARHGGERKTPEEQAREQAETSRKDRHADLDGVL